MEQLGQYHIIRRLGAGAMGEVWLAEHALLQCKRALKVLLPSLAEHEEFGKRFVEEGRLLAALEHPNIVRVHDMIRHDGIHAIAMDFVSPDGKAPQTLDDLLKTSGGKLPPDRVRAILLQVCDATSYAHSRNVLHRDLKPGNILLGRNGEVRVADFGLAKVIGEDFLRSSIASSLSGTSMPRKKADTDKSSARAERSLGGEETSSGEPEGSSISRSLVGTYNYMPPEVQDGGEWTAQGDIFALGCIGYVMLTGRRPIGAYEPPSELDPSIPTFWDNALTRCLKVVPGRRWASVEEFRAALMASDAEHKKAPGHRSGRGRFAAVLLLSAVTAIGGALIMWRTPQERSRIPVLAEGGAITRTETQTLSTPIPTRPPTPVPPMLSVPSPAPQPPTPTPAVTQEPSTPVPTESPTPTPTAHTPTPTPTLTPSVLDELKRQADEKQERLDTAKADFAAAEQIEQNTAESSGNKIKAWETALLSCRAAEYRLDEINASITRLKDEVPKATTHVGLTPVAKVLATPWPGKPSSDDPVRVVEYDPNSKNTRLDPVPIYLVGKQFKNDPVPVDFLPPDQVSDDCVPVYVVPSNSKNDPVPAVLVNHPYYRFKER